MRLSIWDRVMQIFCHRLWQRKSGSPCFKLEHVFLPALSSSSLPPTLNRFHLHCMYTCQMTSEAQLGISHKDFSFGKLSEYLLFYPVFLGQSTKEATSSVIYWLLFPLQLFFFSHKDKSSASFIKTLLFFCTRQWKDYAEVVSSVPNTSML